MNRYSMQRAKYRYKVQRQGKKSGSGFWVIILVVLLLLLGQAIVERATVSDTLPANKLDKTYSPRQLQKDFDFLLATLEEVHPALYAIASSEEIADERERVATQLDTQMTRLEFYRLAAPIVSRFGDGHTQALLPKAEIEDYIAQGALLFPLDLTFNEEGVFVKENYTQDSLVASGTQVLGINGIPIDQIENHLLEYVSGERISWRQKRLTDLFRWQLYINFGIESPYEVTVLRTTQRGSTPLSRTFLGLTGEELEAKRASMTDEPPSTKPWLYHPVEDRYVHNVGLIDFNSFSDLKGFEAFLDTTFRTIREQGIEDLIIDLRGNGGGNSELGDRLIEYLYDKPYRQISRMDVKVSPQIKRYFASWLPWYLRFYPPLSNEWMKRIWETPEGEIASFDSPPHQPGEMPFRFEGGVYVLIDVGTFSSATMFAATVKDYSIGTLIGEETGGLATSFGELYRFQLPVTKLGFTSSCKRFIRPNGEEDEHGVLPDITPDPANFRRPVEDMDITTTLLQIRDDRRTRAEQEE